MVRYGRFDSKNLNYTVQSHSDEQGASMETGKDDSQKQIDDVWTRIANRVAKTVVSKLLSEDG